MTLRTQLINDIRTFDTEMLSFTRNFIDKLKQKSLRKKNQLKKYAGILSDKDADEINNTINEEFNSIEGEW